MPKGLRCPECDYKLERKNSNFTCYNCKTAFTYAYIEAKLKGEF